VAKRIEVIERHPETGQVELEDVIEAVQRWAVVTHTVGGVFQVGAHREELSPGEFETSAVLIQWSSFAPAQRHQEDPGEEENEDGAPQAEALEPVGLTE
jgi:hypothetical protein